MAATGLAIFGAVNTSITLVEKIGTLLVDLGKRWRKSKDITEKINQLSELVRKIEDLGKSITERVESCPRNTLGAVTTGIIDAFKGKMKQSVEGATAAMEKLGKYGEPSAGPSSGWTKFREQVRASRVGRAAKIESILGALDKAKSCLSEALDAASNIELHLRHEANYAPQTTKHETFAPHFDSPDVPDDMVLDFCSMETQEGRLLRKFLELREKGSVDGISAVGRGSAMHGMGGVGKTTTLRAICYREEVRKAFPDGICFLEFGQNAKDINVQRQLERCIGNFGGVSVAAKMEEQSSLEGVIHQAARWLREKEVLFVCDDLWRSPTSEYGYLPLLKRLLVDAPRSKLLVSTRDQKIAKEVSENCVTFGTLLPHGPSARNLLGQFVFGETDIETLKKPDIQGYVEKILDVCAGLQLALCMAGRALRTAIEEFDDVQKGFQIYTSQLEHDQRPDDTDSSAQLYDHGLSHIVEASLVQCEQWAEKTMKKVEVRDLFCSLCVLQKQMVMPSSMLSNLWGLGSRETDRIVRKFADLGVIAKTIDKVPSEDSQNEVAEGYGVRLHDLILVLCQEMVGVEQKKRHGNVIDGLRRSKSVWIGEEIPGPEEWWRMKNGAYVYGNLSRHMVKGGRGQALVSLLSDVRWTLRRVEVGGWLALKMDFEVLFEHIDDGEAEDIKLVYGVLKRHWSEVSKDEQLLTYYIGGSLSGEERKNKFTAQYSNSMMRYLSRPLLVPRWKFLGPQDSRELSLLTFRNGGGYMPIDFSPSGDIAVLGTWNQISLWSVTAQKELWSVTVESEVRCVAISAKGRLIVSGHGDGTFQRWDTKNGETVGVQVEAHSSEVTCVAISKDGSSVVTGSGDKSLRVWDAKNGEPKGNPMNHEDVVSCVAVCENESMIVSGSDDRNVCRWNIETSALVGEPIRGHEWEVRCVSVDENEKMIVSGSVDNTLVRWDAITGKQIGEPMRGHSNCVDSVSISACGKMIVSGSWDGTLRMWDTVNGNPMGEPFQGHFDFVASVRFTEQNGVIVSGSCDGTIRRWRTVPSVRISESTQRCDGGVRHITFSDGRQKLVTCSMNGTLIQWDASNGKQIGKAMKAKLDRAECVAFKEERGMILAVYRDFVENNYQVIRWNTSTCEMTCEPIVLRPAGGSRCAAVSSNGEMIVTGSRDGTVQRWCTRSGDAIGETMRGHKDGVQCVAFSCNDSMVVTGSIDGSIIRWSTANGEQIGNPLLHNAAVYSICINAEGTIIVSSSYDGGLCRWDVVNGLLLGESPSKEDFGPIIWTNNDCTKMVSWSEMEETIRYWCVGSGGTIHETSALLVSADIVACAIDLNHGVAAVSSWNGAVGVCDIH